MSVPTAQFLAEYARHRAAEGRGYSGDSIKYAALSRYRSFRAAMGGPGAQLRCLCEACR